MAVRLEGEGDHRRSRRPGQNGRTVFRYRRVAPISTFETLLKRNGWTPGNEVKQPELAL